MKKQHQVCELSGCKFDIAYAVLDEKKIYRITFSKSLAEYIAKLTDKKVSKIKIFLGKEIRNIDESNEKLFAIVKAKNNWPLRITFFKEAAKLWKADTTKIFSLSKIEILS